MSNTIAAIATAYGEGGISIIRISGDNSKDILDKIFIPSKNKEIHSRVMNYGYIVDPRNQEEIDEVLCVYMKAPHTYTCEDVVEIQCHGSIVSQQKILELVLDNGATLAEPGEFTKRAFLNGRLDLSQAEAVIDLVRAKSNKSFDVALSHLKGDFSERIGDIRNKIKDILVDMTVNIDYPDEDIEELTYDKLGKGLEEVRKDLKEILNTADTGKIIKEGLKISIIGKPNVGKSSFMNALLNQSRAIVTEIAGTTRDTIEESLTIGDVPVVITDTAGIRETENKIEKIGIDKSKDAFNKADLVVFVIDGSRALEKEDEEIIRHLEGKKVIVLLNKKDQGEKITEEEIYEKIPDCIIARTSFAQTDKASGIEDVKKNIHDLVFTGKVKQGESVVITNARHRTLINDAYKSITEGVEATQARQPLEFIEIDVNESYQKLGEIIGESVGDDILTEVFSRFCLGK